MRFRVLGFVFLLLFSFAAVSLAGNGNPGRNGVNHAENAQVQGEEAVLPWLMEISVITDSSGTVLGISEGSEWHDPCIDNETSASERLCTSRTLFHYIYTVGSVPEKRVLKREKGRPEVVGVTGPLVRVSEVGEATAVFPKQEQLVVKKSRENGKTVISSGKASIETEDEILIENETNTIYVSSGGKNYQLYLSPDKALERAEEEGYEPAGGAELKVLDDIPTYVVYAKKPNRFFFLTLGETEVVLGIDQTGEVSELSAESLTGKTD